MFGLFHCLSVAFLHFIVIIVMVGVFDMRVCVCVRAKRMKAAGYMMCSKPFSYHRLDLEIVRRVLWRLC